MCGVLGRAVAVRPGAHPPAAVDAVHMQRVIEARAEGGGRQGVADGARRDDLSARSACEVDNGSSYKWWVTRTVLSAGCSRATVVRASHSSSRPAMSRPVAGSSTSSSRGDDISARPRDTVKLIGGLGDSGLSFACCA